MLYLDWYCIIYSFLPKADVHCPASPGVTSVRRLEEPTYSLSL